MEALYNNIPSIISAIGVIVAAYFSYNQYTKNKKADLKIEQFKQEEEAKSLRRADNSAIIFGELWKILHETHADRVYILQPHPLGNECYVSVYYEVKRKGIEPIKPHAHDLRISEIAKFSSDLVKNICLTITDANDQLIDKFARSLFISNGCKSAIIYRMNNNVYDWVGSIFCEFMQPFDETEVPEMTKVISETATYIQYLLPEYK